MPLEHKYGTGLVLRSRVVRVAAVAHSIARVSTVSHSVYGRVGTGTVISISAGPSVATISGSSCATSKMLSHQ